MISVLLIHPTGREFALTFPEATGFERIERLATYQITNDESILAEVPTAHTLYIGTVEMQLQPGVVNA